MDKTDVPDQGAHSGGTIPGVPIRTCGHAVIGKSGGWRKPKTFTGICCGIVLAAAASAYTLNAVRTVLFPAQHFFNGPGFLTRNNKKRSGFAPLHYQPSSAAFRRIMEIYRGNYVLRPIVRSAGGVFRMGFAAGLSVPSSTSHTGFDTPYQALSSRW